MIQITYTHRNGVRQLTPVTIAIDPEKIVSITDSGLYALIEYGETFDRRRQPVTYKLTTSRAAILAEIDGTYDTKETLALTVLWSNTEEYKPHNVASYALDLQERYIVDMRDAVAWINQTKVSCVRIEFVPASFVPVIIFVQGTLDDLVPDIPAAVTTTTTEEPEVTTTTEEETATTTEEEGGRTTTEEETVTTTEEEVVTTTSEEPAVTTTTSTAG